MSAGRPDLDKFRLRRFVDRLAAIGELEVHDEPVALAGISAIIEASPKAVLFRNAGPERFEIVGGVSGSRRRLAEAFGCDPRKLASEVMRRLGNPQPIVEVASADAPVHAVVLTGDAVDLTRLPFHLQHERDGGVYISSGLDFTVDPADGKRNVGARRLMLRGRRELRTNLTDESDLKRIYKAAVARQERLPIAFAVGSHPLDLFTSGLKIPTDEFALLGTLRGAPVPLVRCVSSDLLVPADAELVIEGWLDEQGWREMDGPYGEFWGYYGPMHIDPVIHVTAITMRRDVLHQTVLHGAMRLARQEASHSASVAAEMLAIRALRAAGIEPAAVYAPPEAPIFHHLRIALADATPELARAAMDAAFEVKGVKNVTVVDDDVDIFDDADVTWAMAARFDPGRDLYLSQRRLAGFYADPNADAEGLVAKVGFDATGRNRSGEIARRRPRPPSIVPVHTNADVRAALASGPKAFCELMAAVGSTDGREIALELDRLREEGALTRLDNGEYALTTHAPGRPRVV